MHITTVRIPEEIYRQARENARADRRSFNAYVVHLLEQQAQQSTRQPCARETIRVVH